jgi:putative acetyltransferase
MDHEIKLPTQIILFNYRYTMHDTNDTIPTFRKIRPGDNPLIEAIVRKAMTEFNANPKTTIIGDPSLKTMYENYREERSVYYIAELEGVVVGGCGIKQLDGSKENICELQRMFLSKEARGKGIGKKLMELCLSDAKKFNYKQVYLETLSDQHEAMVLYKKTGFKLIPLPLGDTGHGGCDVNMICDII